MNDTKPRRRKPAASEDFYEMMPMAAPAQYHWGPTPPEPVSPAEQQSDDLAKRMAIITLVFTVAAALVVGALLIWGIEAAQESLPALNTPGNGPGQ